MKRNVLITKNSIIFVPRNLSASLMKKTLQLNSCTLHTVSPLCQFSTTESIRLLNSKHTRNYQRPCHVSVAVAVGLLVGWTVLELHQHTVGCVAEATETNECHDNKEPIDQQCRVVSLEEAISESDQLLQRVKVMEK